MQRVKATGRVRVIALGGAVLHNLTELHFQIGMWKTEKITTRTAAGLTIHAP
jgi:hypothetical protein